MGALQQMLLSVKPAAAAGALTWTDQTSVSTFQSACQLFWNGSVFIMVNPDMGSYLSYANVIYTSTDGISWTNVLTDGAGKYPSYFSWSSGKSFMGHSSGSLGTTIMNIASTSAVNSWSTNASFASAMSDAPLAVAYNGSSLYVGISSFWADNLEVLTSSDGVTWTSNTSLSTASYLFPDYSASSAPGIFYGFYLVYFNGLFMLFAADGNYATSTNGTSWTQQTGLTSLGFGASTFMVYNHCFYGTKLVICGPSGKVFHTTDGTSWTACSLGISSTVTAVGTNGTRLIAATYPLSDSKFTTDLTTWSAESNLATAHSAGYIAGIAHNGTKWLVAGATGAINPPALPFGTAIAMTAT